ncbi:DNA-directed RNA polymerase II subunit RPB11 [Physcia stellaris]|nr:DNA-directed RNA polymerase II subunit RPB11 [Physcia stellaris]
MVFHGPVSLRCIVSRGAPHLQRRWAQVHDVRFLATHRQADKITEKYREKLQEKAKALRLKDVDELKTVYKDRIQAQKKSASIATVLPSSNPNSPFPPPPPPPQPSTRTPPTPIAKPVSEKPSTPPGIKHLSFFIDIPKTLSLPPKEIEYIWRLRHASSPRSLCASIPHSTYTRIEATAKRHPQFILPLPREGQGAEIHFLQWTFPTTTTATVLFTHLAEFKLRGEFSQPHTTVTHHLDLAGPKGLVLLQGDVVEGRGVSVEEGRWLLMCLQKFYGGVEEKGERKKLLEQFSQGDGGFKVEELLEEAEKIV